VSVQSKENQKNQVLPLKKSNSENQEKFKVKTGLHQVMDYMDKLKE